MSTRSQKKVQVSLNSSKDDTKSAESPASEGIASPEAGQGTAAPKKKKGNPKKKIVVDPISVSDGVATEYVVDAILPGLVSFEWKRRYSSAEFAVTTSLGRGGWRHSLDQWIEPDDEGLTLYNWDDCDLEFGVLSAQGTALHRGCSLLLRRSGERFEILDLATRYTRHYAPSSTGGKAWLRAIADNYGNRLTLHYNGESLVRVTDTAGREIHICLDDRHRIVSLDVDVQGHVQRLMTYAYTAEGELASATNPLGYAITYAYDGQHRIVEKCLQNGHHIRYEYDPVHGRVVRSSGDSGFQYIELTYDFDKRTTTTHGNPEPRVYTWDARGNVTREATFDQRFVEDRVFDADNLRLAQKNAAGEASTFEYDARGFLARHTDPAGNITVFERVDDLVRRVLRPDGTTRAYDYDGYGGLCGVTLETGARYSVDRDRKGRIVAVYGPSGLVERYAYDEAHNLVLVTGPEGEVTSYAYDDLGRAVERRDPLGRTTRLDYDAADNVVRVRRPDGTSVGFEHDGRGNVTAIHKPGGDIRLEYMAADVLTRAEMENGAVWTFGYDTEGKPRTIRNPNGEEYAFRYDRAGNVVEERTFDGRALRYSYDLAGRLQRVQRPDRTYRAFAYDPLGNALEETSSHGMITYERDKLGRLREAILEEGPVQSVVAFERDAVGRIVAEDQDGAVLRYTYDAEGRVATRTLPGGEVTTYRYDLSGRLAEVEHGGAVVRITHDAAGQETLRQLVGSPVGVATKFDSMGRLASQDAVAVEPEGKAAIEGLVARRWQYDVAGRPTQIEDARWGPTAYRYDNVDNLIGYTRRGLDTAFDYDPADYLAGIYRGLRPNGVRWERRPGDLVTYADDIRYEYDENGRRTRKIEEPAHEGERRETKYTWDCRDRLRESALPSGETARYFYDAFGRRTQKVIFSAEPKAAHEEQAAPRVTRFLWDGNVLASEVTPDGHERAWVHEPGTFLPLLQCEQGEAFLFVLDQVGMARELLDRQGRVTWAAFYDPWARVASVQRDDGARRAACIESPFRMLGQYWDDETGLACTRYRYWDPAIAKWISPDPLGVPGARRLMAFDGCPTIDVDALGLETERGKTGVQVKTLAKWLKDEPALLQEARDKFRSSPEWQGIDPDKSPVFLRSKVDADGIRAMVGESGGHHPHGLALGGAPGQTLTFTGETGSWKNPDHSAATGLQVRIINAIRRQQ